MRIIYTFSIRLYYLGILIASLFNQKARLWIKGRKNLFEILSKESFADKRIVWFHCSSLGEFEAGRTVIEKFRIEFPEYKILMTFFSPSGYEIRKNYEHADYICYLPIDTPAKARKFVKLVKPDFAVFVRYDFWFNFLNTLSKENIPVYFISSIFRKSQHFFKGYGAWFRKHLKQVEWIFVQDKNSENLLKDVGVTNVSISGDSRFDRVIELTKNKKPFPEIEEFKGDSLLFIGGSTWPKDEAILKTLFDKKFSNLKFIIAPHDVSESHVNQILELIKEPVIRYSKKETWNNESRFFIIDTIGILNQLYQYADIVYIGGGFGVSIHNIQEPACYGNPILFGPVHDKFKEAKDLIELGGAFCINNPDELLQTCQPLIDNNDFRKKSSEINKKYIVEQAGATDKILEKIKEKL